MPLAPGAGRSDPKAKILAGADTTLRTPDQGTRRYPPITAATVTAIVGKKYINKHFPTGTKHVFWASVECGLVLPSISAWEVVSKEKFKTTGGYMCRFCKGFWKASRGGTRLLQITGWHKDKAACLQLVMDEPPEQLYNQWIRDRMEFYKRVEPTEPPRDAASLWRCEHPAHAWPGGCLHCPVVGHPEQPGEVRVGGHPLSGKGGDLEGSLGRVSLPFWRWRSIFTPHRDLGASGLGWGEVLGCFPFFFWGGSLFAVVSPLFQHATTAGCLEPEAAQFGCPKDGPYRPLFEESGCGRIWVP